MLKKQNLLLIAVLLSGCSNDEQVVFTDDSLSTDNQVVEQSNVKARENNSMIQVTLPSEYAELYNIEESVTNETIKANGDHVYTMTKQQLESAIAYVQNEIEAAIAALIASKEAVSVYDLAYEKDFTRFNVIVDRAEFDNNFDAFVIYKIVAKARYYQLLTGNAREVVVSYVDHETQQTFETKKYENEN